MSTLAERLAAVDEGIEEALRVAGRRSDTVTRIVVTKFQPISLIEELIELGVRDLGESRHQEAEVKAREVAASDVVWHFVGQLQSKKARAVRGYAGVIHSVDRESLIAVLDAPAADPVDVFLQVNLTADPSRGGVPEPEVERMTERLVGAQGVRLLGVMAVAPMDEEPRAAFARLRAASERVLAIAPGAAAISAGMSLDYAEAIAEGATHLRIGTAITGNRPRRG